MNRNRRNFLKLAGISGLGLYGSCKLKGTGTTEFNSKKSSLDNIRLESSKNYSQVFNMSGYAAPSLDKVRVDLNNKL